MGFLSSLLGMALGAFTRKKIKQQEQAKAVPATPAPTPAPKKITASTTKVSAPKPSFSMQGTGKKSMSEDIIDKLKAASKENN